MPTSTGKAVTIRSTVGATGVEGFLTGIAAMEGVATVICPPAGIIFDKGIGVGAGLGALGKAIFG